MIIYSKSTEKEIKAWNDRQRAYEESIRSPDFGKKPLPSSAVTCGDGNSWKTVNSYGQVMTLTWWK